MASISLPMAIIGAGALGAGSSLYGASTAANAAKSAAGTQANSAQQALALQSHMFDVTNQNLTPFRQIGQNALFDLAGLTGVGGSNDGQIAQLQAELQQLGYQPGGVNNSGQTPGMVAAMAAGPHSGNGLMDALGGVALGGLFKSNASPIQDIAAALQKGLPISDASWAAAGFGPGGAALDGGAGANPNQPRIDQILSQIQQLQSSSVGGNPLTAPLTAPFQPTMAQLEATPGYQFTNAMGLRAVQNQATSQGLGSSGPAMANAAQYAAGLASQTYQQQFQNYWTQNQNIYDMLSRMATGGQNAAAGQATNALSFGNSAGNLITGAGNALASGIVGSANALTSGATGVAGSLGNTGLLYAMSQNGLFGSGGTLSTPSVNVTPGLFPSSGINSWAGPDNYVGGTAVG